MNVYTLHIEIEALGYRKVKVRGKRRFVKPLNGRARKQFLRHWKGRGGSILGTDPTPGTSAA